MGQSEGINNYNFMKECIALHFLPKSGQACLCHLVNTHNVITSIVSLTRNVYTNYQEVYDENSSGHLFH